MKKMINWVLILGSIVIMGSCTNDEGNSDIDIITPNDSTDARAKMIRL